MNWLKITQLEFNNLVFEFSPFDTMYVLSRRGQWALWAYFFVFGSRRTHESSRALHLAKYSARASSFVFGPTPPMNIFLRFSGTNFFGGRYKWLGREKKTHPSRYSFPLNKSLPFTSKSPSYLPMPHLEFPLHPSLNINFAPYRAHWANRTVFALYTLRMRWSLA